ncbi:DUF1292 domain-containing protein [Peptoniphilaceae bacterium SGI.131]
MTDKDLEMEFEENEDFDIITLTLEDDTELECAVLDVFDVDEYSYIALLPLNEEGEEDENSEVLLYRFTELEDEEIQIDMIETDEEFEKVSKAYYALEEHDHDHGHGDGCCGHDDCGCGHKHE